MDAAAASARDRRGRRPGHTATSAAWTWAGYAAQGVRLAVIVGVGSDVALRGASGCFWWLVDRSEGEMEPMFDQHGTTTEHGKKDA